MRSFILPAAFLLIVAACGPSSDRAGDAHDAGRDSATRAAGSDTGAHAAEGHAATGHAAGEGGLALLPIMQTLGSEMNALTYALMTDDHEAVARSAAAIAEHAPISAGELERIRAELGAEMAAFEAVDESVHVASVRLHEAARAHRLPLVVERLGEVQRGCVSCHTQFRERLRTNR